MIKLLQPKKVEKAICTEFENIEEIQSRLNNELLNSMIKICVENNGIGLAGAQVGISKKFFIALNTDLSEWELFINPKYKQIKNEERVQSTESCLTYGKDKYVVDRYPTILAEWQKLSNIDGSIKTIVRELDSLSSIVFQHETDHCEGITIAMIGEKMQ